MRDELVERFGTDGLLKKAAVFDPKKLEWMNGQHLSRLPMAEVALRVRPALVAAGLVRDVDFEARHEWIFRLLDLLRVRARTIDDIVRQATPFLRDELAYDPEAVAKQWKDRAATREVLVATGEALATLVEWTPTAMEALLRALAEGRGVQAGKLFQPLRVALTGLSVSPGIFEVLELLGRDRSVSRVRSAVAHLDAGA